MYIHEISVKRTFSGYRGPVIIVLGRNIILYGNGHGIKVHLNDEYHRRNIDLGKFADLVMRGMARVIGGGVISGGKRCQVLDG